MVDVNKNITELFEFIPGSVGSLFTASTFPVNNSRHKKNIVLIISPFGEEMNRSRGFLTLLRKQLAVQGFTVIQPDLFGTGDSAGEFVDASVKIWLDDLEAVAEVFKFSNEDSITILGVRAGCLLAHELFNDINSSEAFTSKCSLIYVQPVDSGYNVIQHLLRTRVATERFSGNKSESSEVLWKRFESGDNLSIAGYDIGAKMAIGMKNLRIDHQLTPPSNDACWIQLTNSALIESMNPLWNVEKISAKPFWQLQEYEPEQHLVSFIGKCASSSE